jgi:hypothetical protein
MRWKRDVISPLFESDARTLTLIVRTAYLTVRASYLLTCISHKKRKQQQQGSTLVVDDRNGCTNDTERDIAYRIEQRSLDEPRNVAEVDQPTLALNLSHNPSETLPSVFAFDADLETACKVLNLTLSCKSR